MSDIKHIFSELIYYTYLTEVDKLNCFKYNAFKIKHIHSRTIYIWKLLTSKLVISVYFIFILVIIYLDLKNKAGRYEIVFHNFIKIVIFFLFRTFSCSVHKKRSSQVVQVLEKWQKKILVSLARKKECLKQLTRI